VAFSVTFLRVDSLDRKKDFLKTGFAKLSSGQCTRLLLATPRMAISQPQTVKNTQHDICIKNYLLSHSITGPSA
jgi:hypothetical protein